MGYLNPLLHLPAGRKLLALPDAHRGAIEDVMRELREQANTEAENAWRRRKGPMAAYWRAVATYARHVAHALSKGSTAPEPLVHVGYVNLRTGTLIRLAELADTERNAVLCHAGDLVQVFRLATTAEIEP